MTQKTLAKKSKISERHLIDIEKGESDPKISTIHKIAVTLGVEVKDLFPLPTETSPNKNSQQNFSTNAAEKQLNT